MTLPTPPPGATVESKIRRDIDGNWFDDGVRVEHPGIVRSFDAWIDRHDNGRYVLKNSVNWAFVEVEGAPIDVRRVAVEHNGLSLALSDGRTETLQPDTLRQDAYGVLYCQVRKGRLTARFSRQAMFDLAPVVEEGDDGVALRLGGVSIQPEVADDPVR